MNKVEKFRKAMRDKYSRGKYVQMLPGTIPFKTRLSTNSR